MYPSNLNIIRSNSDSIFSSELNQRLTVDEHGTCYLNSIPPGAFGEFVRKVRESSDQIPFHIAIASTEFIVSALLGPYIATPQDYGAISSAMVVVAPTGAGKSIVVKFVGQFLSQCELDPMDWPASGTALLKALSNCPDNIFSGYGIQDELLWELRSLVGKSKTNSDTTLGKMLELWSANESSIISGRYAADGKYSTGKLIGPTFSFMGGGTPCTWNQIVSNDSFLASGWGNRLEFYNWGLPRYQMEDSNFQVNLENFQKEIAILSGKMKFYEKLRKNEGVRFRCRSTNESKELARQFRNLSVDQIRVGNWGEFSSRLAEMGWRTATRITAFNSCFSNSELIISKEVMEWSIRWVLRRYRIMIKDYEEAETEEVKFMRKLVTFLRSKESATRADISKGIRTSLRAQERKSCIGDLIASGILANEGSYFRLRNPNVEF